MKNLIFIVHTGAQVGLADLLRGLDQIQGFTFSHVEGHGAQVEHDPLLSSRDKVVGYTPRVRVDILIEDADLDAVLLAIRNDRGRVLGQGFYWVTAVESHGHL